MQKGLNTQMGALSTKSLGKLLKNTLYFVWRKMIALSPVHYINYTVSELEVRYLKRLEMIGKQNNFDITCLYLQEYKKEFAF